MSDERHFRVAVIGAGPAGIGTAVSLAKRGIGPVVLIERRAEAGGTPMGYRRKDGGVPTFVEWTRGRVVFGEELAERIDSQKPWQLVAGGAERQDSVWNGVNATAAGSEIVAIQDGARPCTPLAATQLAVATAREMGAAVLAGRLADTLKRGDGEGQIVGTVDRKNLWAVQTPQVFRREIILAALAKVRDEGLSITDDTAACEALGQAVKLIECDQPNPKATTPADLPYIETLLAE